MFSAKFSLENPPFKLTDDYFFRVVKQIQDFDKRGQLTDVVQFKILINSCYRIADNFQNSQNSWLDNTPNIRSMPNFQSLIAWTDTWEEAWFRVFSRHGQMMRYNIGFSEKIPYYGYNPLLICASELLS